LRNKSIFQISTLVYFSSISICNLLIDLPSYVGSDVLTAVTKKGTVSWDVTPCSPEEVHRHSSEMSVNFYWIIQTTFQGILPFNNYIQCIHI
jgi:hypothetical protein